MTNNIQLKTLLPTTNGVFAAMERSEKYSVPWEKGQPLDLMYIGGHSGEKLSTLLVRSLANGNAPLATSDIEALANLILMQFSKNWEKLYATLSVEYDPISNYDMIEEGTDTTVDSGTISNDTTTDYGRTEDTNTKNVNDKTETHTFEHGEKIVTENEHGEVVTTETENSGLQNNNVYGFNSSESVPSDTQSASGEGKDTATHSGTDTDTTVHSGTDTDTITDNGTDTITGKVTTGGSDTTQNTQTLDTSHRTEHRLTRTGNIGVTTSQQMLQSERDLWQWNFFENVFADVDKVLALAIY